MHKQARRPYLQLNEGRRADRDARGTKERRPPGAGCMMNQTEPMATLADIEAEARHLQAQAFASMCSAVANRVRALFVSAPMNTETGRTA